MGCRKTVHIKYIIYIYEIPELFFSLHQYAIIDSIVNRDRIRCTRTVQYSCMHCHEAGALFWNGVIEFCGHLSDTPTKSTIMMSSQLGPPCKLVLYELIVKTLSVAEEHIMGATFSNSSTINHKHHVCVANGA